MKNVNWGIIGLGNIASTVADAFQSLQNCKLKAIGSKSEEKISHFKSKYAIQDEYCFNNYKDLINCPEIDVIYIALPNNLHHEWIVECINANKNILVEKPALMNVNQVLDIKKKINENHVYFSEAFMFKFCPHIKAVTDEIKRGSIGELLNMSSDFSIKTYKSFKIFGFSFRKPDFQDRKYNQALGGGSILDLGCYPVSFSTLVASLKKQISLDKLKLTNVKKNICESNVEISASCRIEFGNDFFSDVSCSFENNSNQKTTIFGTHGKIILENTWKPNKTYKINLENNNEKKVIELDILDNIYSYQIKEISNQIMQNKKKPENPALCIDNILLNTSILTNWIDYKL